MTFNNFEELVHTIENDLGEEFKNDFRQSRKSLAGLTNLPNNILFSEFDSQKSEWVFNRGGKKEIQYHIFLRDGKLGYGLAINSQRGSFNNDDPAEIANDFGNAFKNLLDKIYQILPNYSFIIGRESDLGFMEEGEFILFGNSIPISNNSIQNFDYQQLLTDLNKQIEVYKLVYNEKKLITKNRKQLSIQMESVQKQIKLLKYKKQIILQGPPGTGKTREAKLIAKEILGLDSIDELKENEQFKIIQFHPSYTYEDFVRGIIVTTDDGVAEYKTLNKILGDFARRANQSNLTGGVDDFERAWNQLVEDINEKKVTKIGTSNVEVEINSQGNIKFASPVATFEKTYELYKFGKTDLKYETYQKIVLNYLKNPKGLYKLQDYIAPQETQSDKPYVLVIDEINRANLSSVLGELIYALEYRGQTVESIYSTVEDGHSLLLPNNLYIIGTMNTADRSVGHIDYAIRRRFAFVEVLPNILEDNTIVFNKELFEKVSALFINNYSEYFKDNERKVILQPAETLSSEFRPEDVWLGHSYFIQKKLEDDKLEPEDFRMKIDYEIKPILMEYVKDGILVGKIGKQKIEDYIKNL